MNGWKRMAAVVILTWSVLLVPDTGTRVYAHTWLDGTPRFHENAVVLAQTLGHDDRAMLAPALAQVLPPAAYKVGDERSFYAINMRDGSQYSLTASCRAVSDRAYIFVEKGMPAALGKMEPLLVAFDTIYDAITDQFGPPPDSIDSDPRVYILLMDIIDGEREDGSQIMGYFDSTNQYRNSQLPRWIRQSSNEVEMFYIDYASLDLKPDDAEGVVAHEFTHLVQWARDPEEATWINEGIAVYAEAMLGYEVEQLVSAFQDKPDTPLLSWFDSLADYGAAYLFFTYVSERYGGTPIIASIVRGEDHGVEGIEQALAAQGRPVSFPDIFSDWVIANYLDDPDLGDGIYGYAAVDVHLKPPVIEDQYPINSKESILSPWAAQYIKFSKEQNDDLDLTVYDNSSRADIVAQVIEFGDETSVSHIKSGEVASGTALISQGNREAILVVTSQPDPPESRRRFSSYAYSAEIMSVVTPVAPIPDMRITTWGIIKRD